MESAVDLLDYQQENMLIYRKIILAVNTPLKKINMSKDRHFFSFRSGSTISQRARRVIKNKKYCRLLSFVGLESEVLKKGLK